MNATDILGFVAAALTTLAFVPQAWQIWTTRNGSGISVGKYAIFSLGVAAWLAYGLLLGAWPIIIANAITLVLAMFILFMKIRLG